ncbi:MAG: LysM peptidoglycan-binding domain-containing protein [Clostridium sp.]
MKKFFLILSIIVMVSSGFCGHNLMNAMAEEQESPNYNKYYTSIVIQEGDSLWTIADKYKSHSGKSTEAYIKELKSMNQLGEDLIHAGNHLTVAYYEKAIK